MQLSMTADVLVPLGAGGVAILIALVVMISRGWRRRPGPAAGSPSSPEGAGGLPPDAAPLLVPPTSLADRQVGGPDSSGVATGRSDRDGDGVACAATEPRLPAVSGAGPLDAVAERVDGSSTAEAHAGVDGESPPGSGSESDPTAGAVLCVDGAALAGSGGPASPAPHADVAAPTGRPGQHRSAAEPAPPSGETHPSDGAAGSSSTIAAAVAQVLAVRAAAGRTTGAEPAPDADPMAEPSPRGDVRDRLLAVLLHDPECAVGAAAELEACRGRLDRLSDAMRHERAALGDVLDRLAAAGLRPDQLARLSDLPVDEVRQLLARATEPTGSPTR